MEVNIYHLYPDHLNLYGDRGNVLALYRRAQWRGIAVNLVPVHPGDRIDFTSCDLLVMGGGPDSEQKLAAADLKKQRTALIESIENGMVLLAVCGSYQLLGSYCVTAAGELIPGLEILDLYTTAGSRRATGNVVLHCSLWDPPLTLVGFENHAGRTFLGSSLQPLGTVIQGYGNNGTDKTEGVIYKNVIGTYLHGALLPRNPWLTDYLLQQALRYRNRNIQLAPLDDHVEIKAHQATLKRSRPRWRKLRL
jgi:CobQ-like glutamine amidotransferase family enzyme